MKKYRVYMVGLDGHVRERDRRCSDEGEAFELVWQLVNGHEAELWQFLPAAAQHAQDQPTPSAGPSR